MDELKIVVCFPVFLLCFAKNVELILETYSSLHSVRFLLLNSINSKVSNSFFWIIQRLLGICKSNFMINGIIWIYTCTLAKCMKRLFNALWRLSSKRMISHIKSQQRRMTTVPVMSRSFINNGFYFRLEKKFYL